MRIALELAEDNPVYEDIATKFFEHFLYIAEAMTNIGGERHRAVGRGRTSSTTTCCNLPGRQAACRCGCARWSG